MLPKRKKRVKTLALLRQFVGSLDRVQFKRCKMKRRLALFGLLLGMMIGLMALPKRTVRPVPEVNLATFSRLHVGMTVDQINNILGKPNDIVQGPMYLHYCYGRKVVIYFAVEERHDKAISGIFRIGREFVVPLRAKPKSTD